MFSGIHIGTSGWSYKHWRELYYPKGVAAKNWLPFYARQFSVSEINGSFYRLPTEATVLKWKEQVPDDFIFCPKMSRYLTHMKKLRQPEEPLDRFFTVFAAMQPKMGPVLLQLPPQLKFDKAVADHFFEVVSKQYSEFSFVLEVRDQSWLHEESLGMMRDHNIGLVISVSGDHFPFLEQITAHDIYFRFHGPDQLYASPHKMEELESYAARFLQWEKEGHAVWAFFNNDIGCHAIDNALTLKQLTGKN
jgi:uncharacterized protein YecE (DUF72 family)